MKCHHHNIIYQGEAGRRKGSKSKKIEKDEGEKEEEEEAEEGADGKAKNERKRGGENQGNDRG